MNGFMPELVVIPDGYFLMGSTVGQENEWPVHRVWIDRFAIGRFPVTNHQYCVFVQETGTSLPPFYGRSQFADPSLPVVGVSWDDSVAYCSWLRDQTGQAVRLPTEAEWERAARGERPSALYPWGDEPPCLRPFPGWDPLTGGPQRVGLNPPNDFGLHDMSEGVHQWCSDYYARDYYHYAPERNPPGAAAGERRASRGGSWRHRIKFSRCAARSSLPPTFRYADYGFRLALTI
jgi:formylglycine-generating enzyme